MKNQYVGDIGDYGKYGLLRFLAGRGIKIGVNWYLTKDDESSDGKFTDYLKRPENTDYILTKEENFEKSLKVLKNAGYKIK